MTMIEMQFNAVPNGSVIEYKNKRYWVSSGLEDRIVTDKNGDWQFIHDLKWKKFKIVFYGAYPDQNK